MLCSIPIIESLIGEDLRAKFAADPAWKSWIAHVEYVKLGLSHSLNRSTSIPLMAQLVKKHHQLYQDVPEYKGFMKPKNHMALHFPQTISDFGLLRLVWCMAYERFNQTFKRIAEISNFVDLLMTLAKFWSMASAKEICTGYFTPVTPVLSLCTDTLDVTSPKHVTVC